MLVDEVRAGVEPCRQLLRGRCRGWCGEVLEDDDERCSASALPAVPGTSNRTASARSTSRAVRPLIETPSLEWQDPLTVRANPHESHPSNAGFEELGQLARGRNRRLCARSTGIGSPTTTLIFGKPIRPRESARAHVPTIRTGTSGTPVASASRAAPRVHVPPRYRPLGEERDRLTGQDELTRPADRVQVAAVSGDRNSAECVHQPGARPIAPGSTFARKWSGCSAASASSGGSSTDSWFAATTHGPGGTRPTSSSR